MANFGYDIDTLQADRKKQLLAMRPGIKAEGWPFYIAIGTVVLAGTYFLTKRIRRGKHIRK